MLQRTIAYYFVIHLGNTIYLHFI